MASIKCFSQTSNELRVYYGFVDSEILTNEELQGYGSYNNCHSYEFGFKYSREISNRLSIETGINFLSTQVQILPAFTGMPRILKEEDLKLISIPIYANYSFGDYFFIYGGPLTDFQLEDKSFDAQSGIGYAFGIGGKFNFKNYKIYITPNFKRHSFIPFEKENSLDKLLELGIQLGVGYAF